MARQLLGAEVWAFEGTSEPSVLREIAEWLESKGLSRITTVFSITFEDISEEDQEERGPLEGATVVAYVAFERIGTVNSRQLLKKAVEVR